jgi:hypothetical protein
MAVIQKYAVGTSVTLLSTELNSLASSSGLTAGVISSVGGTSGLFNNTAAGGSLDGYAFGRYELNLAAPAGALTGNTSANVWFLGTVDGTNYEDGSASIIPARRPDLIIPVRAVSTAQRPHIIAPLFPANCFVLLAHNTGQTWAASGNTLKVSPITWQGA